MHLTFMEVSSSRTRPRSMEAQGVATSTTHPVLLPDIWTTMEQAGMVPDHDTQGMMGWLAPPADTEKQPQRRKRKQFKRTIFTERQKQILLTWLRTHSSNPYPTVKEKLELMEATGLMREQINVWFTNNRVRRKLNSDPGDHAGCFNGCADKFNVSGTSP